MIGENKGGTRIEATDTVMEIVMKMSEGNPGCMTFLLELLQNSKWGGRSKVWDMCVFLTA